MSQTVFQAIGGSVESLLGPSKSLKSYVSDTPQENAILGEAMQVLEALLESLNVGHPIGQLLYDSCREQQKTCGCGMTTLVCLCSYWSAEIETLLRNNIPLPVVFEIFNELLQECYKVFDSLAVSMETLEKSHTNPTPARLVVPRGDNVRRGSSKPISQRASKALSFSRHFSSSRALQIEPDLKSTTSQPANEESHTISDQALQFMSCGLSHGKELAMQLAMKAVQLQRTSFKHYSINTSLIFHHCAVGRNSGSSEVVCGVVTKLHPEMISVIQQVTKKQLKLLAVEGDCTPSWRHAGLQKVSHVTSHDPQLLYQDSSRLTWLKKCERVLRNLQVGVVCVGGVMSPLLWEHCLATSIPVFVGLSKQQLKGICQLSNATPIPYITHCLEKHIGSGIELEVMESGWDISPRTISTHSIKVYSCRFHTLTPSHSHPSPVTAVLCGRTENTVDILRLQFHNCLHRLKLVHNGEGGLLPGGGRTECECVKKLSTNYTHTAHSDGSALPVSSWMNDRELLAEWRPAVCQAFVNGLKRYMARVEMNSQPGVGLYEAMTAVGERLELASSDGGGSWLREMKGGDLACVFDDVRSKRESWRRAVHVLRMVFLSRMTSGRRTS